MTNKILAKKIFLGAALPDFFEKAKRRQIVSKQVKNRSNQVKKNFFQVLHLQAPVFSAP